MSSNINWDYNLPTQVPAGVNSIANSTISAFASPHLQQDALGCSSQYYDGDLPSPASTHSSTITAASFNSDRYCYNEDEHLYNAELTTHENGSHYSIMPPLSIRSSPVHGTIATLNYDSTTGHISGVTLLNDSFSNGFYHSTPMPISLRESATEKTLVELQPRSLDIWPLNDCGKSSTDLWSSCTAVDTAFSTPMTIKSELPTDTQTIRLKVIITFQYPLQTESPSVATHSGDGAQEAFGEIVRAADGERFEMELEVPAALRWAELSEHVIARLSLNRHEVASSGGEIELPGWAPIALERVPSAGREGCAGAPTVGALLGAVTHATRLHLKLMRQTDLRAIRWTKQAVRLAVLSLLNSMTQTQLARISPLTQPIISNLLNAKTNCIVGRERCITFGAWYEEYMERARRESAGKPPPPAVSESSEGSERAAAGDDAAHDTPHLRRTFHPTLELPRMRDWFRACRKPTHSQFRQFLLTLNGGPVRSSGERSPVTVGMLRNWWRNEDQRVKRRQRFVAPNATGDAAVGERSASCEATLASEANESFLKQLIAAAELSPNPSSQSAVRQSSCSEDTLSPEAATSSNQSLTMSPSEVNNALLHF